MRARLFVYLFPILFLACSGKPAYVVSDKKMENVLFDLYIAETEMNENSRIFYNDSAKKQDLLQSVFQKHKISQAKFDTSLVWYNTKLKRYLKINTQVSERYGLWIDELRTEHKRIKRIKELIAGNKLQFNDLKIQDFAKPWLSYPPVDSLILSINTICPDTIMDTPKAIIRFERYCFYEEDIVTESPKDIVRFERYCFYEDE